MKFPSRHKAWINGSVIKNPIMYLFHKLALSVWRSWNISTILKTNFIFVHFQPGLYLWCLLPVPVKWMPMFILVGFKYITEAALEKSLILHKRCSEKLARRFTENDPSVYAHKYRNARIQAKKQQNIYKKLPFLCDKNCSSCNCSLKSLYPSDDMVWQCRDVSIKKWKMRVILTELHWSNVGKYVIHS